MRRAVIANYSRVAIALLMALNSSGCVGALSFIDRNTAADDVAFKAGFTKRYLKAPPFTLTGYNRFNSSGKPLRVYIEGDGCAWQSRRRLSIDPTPKQPMALRLAALDAYDNLAYIARPGQYLAPDSVLCDPAYWSQRRFSPEVVNSLNQSIDELKRDSGASKIELIGYSGGGGLSVLIASKRNDVLSVRTIAGNLDTEALCEYHRVSPLTGSLNPIDAARDIAAILQYHFVGTKDDVVPPFIAEKFFKVSGRPNTIRVIYVKGATHTDGWREHWPDLLDTFEQCPNHAF
ncbi:MAG: alpha/beta hydrolase [Candidatus Omnitrophota bacterium]